MCVILVLFGMDHHLSLSPTAFCTQQLYSIVVSWKSSTRSQIVVVYMATGAGCVNKRQSQQLSLPLEQKKPSPLPLDGPNPILFFSLLPSVFQVFVTGGGGERFRMMLQRQETLRILFQVGYTKQSRAICFCCGQMVACSDALLLSCVYTTIDY